MNKVREERLVDVVTTLAEKLGPARQVEHILIKLHCIGVGAAALGSS